MTLPIQEFTYFHIKQNTSNICANHLGQKVYFHSGFQCFKKSFKKASRQGEKSVSIYL